MSDNLTPEQDLTFQTAGNIWPLITVSPRIHQCGEITNGVSVHEHAQGSFRGAWVMKFEDLQTWYLAAKAYREARGTTNE